MSNEQHDQGAGPGGWQGAAAAAGWYQDPWDARRRRYWDGRQWTGDVSFEPPGNWGAAAQGAPGEPTWPASEGSTPGSGLRPQAPAAPADPYGAVDPTARWGQGYGPQAPAAGAPAWPATAQAPEYPTQAGWGGWGQPPQGPVVPWAGGHWMPAPQPPAPPSSRVHIGVVAAIAAVAILAGIGIGSQIDHHTAASSASSGGSGSVIPGFNGGSGLPGAGGSSPFGGLGGGTGSTGGSGSTGTTGGSTNLSPAMRKVAAQVDRSVVDINTQLGYQQGGAAAGTGMVLTSNGTILTNNHVIDGATEISVTVVSTGKTYQASVVGTDAQEDVAVIQMQGASGLTPISFGSSSSVGRGQSVLAIGNAGGAGGTPSAVTGTVQALNRTITASDSNGANSEQLFGLIQTDAPIQPGDSGGPLVNAQGQVIGMDTAASTGSALNGSSSVGFAIPISNASTIADQIRRGVSTSKIHIGQTGFLGVSVLPDGSSSGASGSIGSGGVGNGTGVTGAAVESVISGSPADKAGITKDDVITAVDGTQITDSTSLTSNLRVHHPGDQVSITWVDAEGASHTATVTLAVGPAT